MQVKYRVHDTDVTIYCNRFVLGSGCRLVDDLIDEFADEPIVLDLRETAFSPQVVQMVLRRLYGASDAEANIKGGRPFYYSAMIDCAYFAEFLNSKILVEYYVEKISSYIGPRLDGDTVRCIELAKQAYYDNLLNETIKLLYEHIEISTRNIIPELVRRDIISVAEIVQRGKIAPVDEFMIEYRSRHVHGREFIEYLNRAKFETFPAHKLKQIADFSFIPTMPGLSNALRILAENVDLSLNKCGKIDIVE